MKLTYLATRVLTDVTNPLEGITPTLDVFGIEFKGRVSIILGGIWALVAKPRLRTLSH